MRRPLFLTRVDETIILPHGLRFKYWIEWMEAALKREENERNRAKILLILADYYEIKRLYFQGQTFKKVN